MKIVIELPDDDAKFLMHSSFIPVGCFEKVHKALLNGTPLPKGHGRLIDEKEVYHEFFCRCLGGVARNVLKETPTIIKADKEGD